MKQSTAVSVIKISSIVSIAAVAIRFIMDFLPSSVVLCGAKRPDQILGNIQGADWKLDASELAALNTISQ